MATELADQEVKTAKLIVIGGVALIIVTVALWLMVFFQILFSFFDSVEWFPPAVNILVVVLAVVVPIFAMWTLRAGARRLIAGQRSIEIEGVDSVVGDLPDASDPMSLDDVTTALLRLNDLDLPDSVTVERDGDKAKVTVPWRVEELKWRTLMTRGNQVLKWRLELTLDGSKGRYRFTEVSSRSQLVGSVASGTLSGSKSGSRGKTMGAGTVSKVWAVGQVNSLQGAGSRGKIRITPADAKVPVFRILRAYGWRPRFNSEALQVWEY